MKSPQLEKLATEGIILEQAYTQQVKHIDRQTGTQTASRSQTHTQPVGHNLHTAGKAHRQIDRYTDSQ